MHPSPILLAIVTALSGALTVVHAVPLNQVSVTLDLTTVLLAVVTALAGIATGYLVRMEARSKATSLTVESTKAQVDLVKVDVNTNHQAQAKLLAEVTEKLAEAARQNLILQEKASAASVDLARATERETAGRIAAARAEGAAVLVAPPPPAVGPAPTVGAATEPLPVKIVATVPVPVETESGRALPRPPPVDDVNTKPKGGP